MPKLKPYTTRDLTAAIADKLRNAATRPNIHGYKDQPKQFEFSSSGAKGRLFIGGNRSGKTVAGAVEAVRYLTGKHPFRETPPPPIRGRAIGVDYLIGIEKIMKPEIARWLPPSELVNGSWTDSYSKEFRTLTLANGSFLEFMSYEQDIEKFAGTSRHFNWFDEEPPHDIFVEANMRLLDTGGDWWISMTPVEGLTWTYDDIYIKAKTEPNIKVVEVDTTENQYLNPGEIEVFTSMLTEDEKNARLHGKYVQLGGLIYKEFSDKNIIDPIPLENLRGWIHVASLDHGFNNPTAWLWGGVDQEGRIVIYDEHYLSGRVVEYHAKAVHNMNHKHGFIPSYYVGDPSIRNTDPITGSSILLEYIDYDVPIVLGNNDVHAGINRVARLFGDSNLPPKLFITRNCVNLINELSHYRWGSWATKRMQYDKNKKEEPHKKNDHACDALRYLVMSRPQVEDQSIPEKTAPVGASVAVSPYTEEVDKGVFALPETSRPSQISDYHLGEDY